MDHLSRRHFCWSAINVASTACLARSVAATDQKDQADAFPLIDTHTHFYDPTRPEGVPWPGKDDKLLYRRMLPQDYKAVAQRHGVTGTVVVECSPRLEDNQWLLDLAKGDPFLVGIVGRLIPGTDEFRKHLRRFSANPLFRGIRITAAEVKQGISLAAVQRDLGQLTEHDLELDVNGGPDLPADVARLAKELPALRIVVDHAANVPIDGKAPPADWLAAMRAAARHPRVYCKVSALVEGTGRSDGQAPKELAFYQPVLDALWDIFGEERLIYGSNWPVSTRFASYAVVQGIVRDHFQMKGKVATERFFWRNALAAYKWVRR